ncbi:DUF349 domain-containing protein [Marinobacterium jannaschii]|uniref:DUF349 domain-containing protein n=1 Tax=Marinobacterium jannaschii TaxID=64970 RepID=UPI00047F14C2|nr:DUF349 domain-containing protein [Marinobacterium jannaschii]
MFILKQFFKPKWQSSNPEARIRAVVRLSDSDPDRTEIISRIALEDQSAPVRKAAIERLESLDLLLRVYRHDQTEENRQTAAARTCDLLLKSPDITEDKRQDAIRNISSPDILTRFILHANNSSLQEIALNQINQDEHLITLLLNSNKVQLRCKAAEKIENPELLESLSKELRGKDKSVHRILRDKLKQLRDAEKLQQDKQQARQELLSTIEQLSQSEYYPQYAARLNALIQEWGKQAGDATTEQAQTFARARELSQQKVDSYQAQQAASRELEQQRQALKEAQQQLCNDAGQLLTETTDPTSDLQQQTAQLKALKQRAEELDNRDKSVSQLLSNCRNNLEARTRLTELQPTLEALLSESAPDKSSPKALRQQLKSCNNLHSKLNWPSQIPQPSVLKQLQALIGRLEQQQAELKKAEKQQQQQLEQLLTEWSLAIEAGEIRNADKIRKQVEPQLPARLSGALDNRVKSLQAQLQELKDWQGYAVLPKKEALCAEMEQLIDSEMLLPQRANRIRQLQQQWRELDSTDSHHSHTLWKRFKAASDRAYEPCENHFSEQRELRQRNLAARKEICQQLEGYLNSIDWDQVDWKALEEILKVAKSEWRNFSPVDRAPGKKAQERFNKLLQSLETPFKAFREKNRDSKQVLVEQARQLLDSEDLAAATEEAKQLQHQWKQAGATFHSQERKLWSEFRQYCNQLFDLYHQQRRQHSDQKQSVREQVNAICDQLDTLQETPHGLTQMQQQLLQAKSQLGELSKEGHEVDNQLSKRFDAALAFIDQQESAMASLQSCEFRTLEQKIELCQQIEAALLEGHSGDLDSRLDAEKQQLDTLPATYAPLMQQRYNLLAQLAEAPEQLEQAVAEQEPVLRQLCIRLEIALNRPSPIEDQALRMEYQMQRLQQALAQQDESPDLTAIKKLEYEWQCAAFSSCFEDLEQRFTSLLNELE